MTYVLMENKEFAMRYMCIYTVIVVAIGNQFFERTTEKKNERSEITTFFLLLYTLFLSMSFPLRLLKDPMRATKIFCCYVTVTPFLSSLYDARHACLKKV